MDIQPGAGAVDEAANAAVDESANLEDQEWDDAVSELFPEVDTKQEEKEDESAESEEDAEKDDKAEEAEDAEKPGEDAADDADDKADEADGAKEDGAEASEPDTAVRDARALAREAKAEAEAVAADVREQMFADVPTQLKDADGDPINSIEDVMKLVNPRTQEPFTEEEAGMWLLAAQQRLAQELKAVDQQVEAIAETSIDLKDQADSITYRYGDLLKSMPELRDEIWADFQETLVRDEKSGIVIKAPVSLERFYERALKPYVELGPKLEAQEAARATAEQESAKVQRVQTRSDRSDIYAPNNTNILDDDEKEWAEAAQSYFGK